MVMLYAAADATTNTIWVAVHRTILSLPATFLLVSLFFASCLTMGAFVLKGLYVLKWDWAFLPWITIVVFWVSHGYNTDSTIPNPSYFIEFLEFAWNATFLFGITGVFRQVKNPANGPVSDWISA